MTILAILPAAVSADEWQPARQTTYRSDNDEYRFKIIPGRAPDRKAVGMPPVRAKGSLFASARGNSGQRWEVALSNPIAPAHAIVSNSGRHVATFDNWGSVGFGGDVVVILGEDGASLYSYSLEDLFDSNEIGSNIEHSASSRWWRSGEPKFDADEMNLVVPTRAGVRVISLMDGVISKNTSGVTHWADGAETQALLRRFLEIFHESKRLKGILKNGRNSELSRKLDATESEGAGIVLKFSGAAPRDDYRKFDDESMIILMEAARRFDTPLYVEIISEIDRVSIANTEEQLKTISLMLYAYEMSNGRFPPDNEGLEALTFSFDRSAYLQPSDLKDAWGNPIVYTTDYIASPVGKPFLLFSSGSDGIQNTSDDIYPPDGR